MWTMFEVFFEFVTTLLQFCALVFRPRGSRDLGSGIEPAPTVLEACRLNHWTTRKVPIMSFLDEQRILDLCGHLSMILTQYAH